MLMHLVDSWYEEQIWKFFMDTMINILICYTTKIMTCWVIISIKFFWAPFYRKISLCSARTTTNFHYDKFFECFTIFIFILALLFTNMKCKIIFDLYVPKILIIISMITTHIHNYCIVIMYWWFYSLNIRN